MPYGPELDEILIPLDSYLSDVHLARINDVKFKSHQSHIEVYN